MTAPHAFITAHVQIIKRVRYDRRSLIYIEYRSLFDTVPKFRGVACVDPCRREIAARTDVHLCPPRRMRSAKRFSRYFG